MKNISFAIITFFLISCSNNSNTATNSDGQGGSLAIFVLKGNYLYTVDNQKLNVFSLINPAVPVKVNEINVGFNIETLSNYQDKLLIGSRNGMFIYSATNPEEPKMLSAVSHFTACDPVIANETNAFVTLHSNTTCGNNINVLEIYDIVDPTFPKLLHRRNLTYPKGIGLYKNYLFVCDDKIKIFDIQNTTNPLLVTAIDKECFDVIVKDNSLYAIASSGIFLYNLNVNNNNLETNFVSQVLF